MIHPEPIPLGGNLRCYVELVPERSMTALKPLVADPRRPLESVLLHFYRLDVLVGSFPWQAFFSPTDQEPAHSAGHPQFADGTELSRTDLETINTDAWLICGRYGYESFVRYAPIAA